MKAIRINTFWGSLIINELAQNRCDLFCISPGSRSTPLTVAAARHPQAKTIVCYDERGAAFFALGYARATGRPSPLICTSGTAAANYLPAVIEADIDNVPMIVLSADRPPELRHTMANQTIVQPPMFAPYTRWRVDLPTPTEEIPPEYIRTTIAQAVYRAIRAPQGVVHLNCMFREPLIEEVVSDEWLVVSDEPYTRYVDNPAVPDLSSLVPIIEQAERGLILVGQLRTEAEQEAVLALGERLQWPLLPDITSGLRLGTADHPFIIHHFDQILLASDNELPDVIVHIGGQMVSKRLMQFVGKTRPKHHIVLNPSPERYDPMHTVTHRFEGDIPATLPTFIPSLSHITHNKRWLARWQTQNQTVQTKIDIDPDIDTDINEIDVAQLISRTIPPESALFIGNSMPIRDMDMFGAADGERVRVAANRGASGIDGNLATGMGFGVGCGRPTTIIVGDLTFIHDLNSLTLLRQIDSKEVPITIVVINNSGGGIFHNLPISQVEDVFEPYFGTPHPFQFEDVARGFGIAYQRVTTRPELQNAYGAAVSASAHRIIEVTTDRVANTAAHKKLQSKIKDALQRTVR